MTDQEFITYMKANPQQWGRKKHFDNKPGCKNAFRLSQGWVCIYSYDGTLSKSFYFENYSKKILRVNEAMKQIRNLKRHYVEINHTT